LCKAFNCGHYLPTAVLIIIGISSPTYFFITGLKPYFGANPSHRSLSFSSSGFPKLFTVISEHIPSFTFYFFCFTLFICPFRAVD